MPEPEQYNSKRTYQPVNGLTSEKQDRSSTIQDRSGKCLTEKQEVLSRWTEYYSEQYNHENCDNNTAMSVVSPKKKIYNRSFVREMRLQ